MPVRGASGAGRAAPQRHANTQKGKGPRVVRLAAASEGPQVVALQRGLAMPT